MYSKLTMPDNVKDLQIAARQLQFSFLDTGEAGFEFQSGFRDITGGIITQKWGHPDTYLQTRTDYITYKGTTARVGICQQEAINEFATGYIVATPEKRVLIDTVMYDRVPDLWTAMRGWIDFLMGH